MKVGRDMDLDALEHGPVERRAGVIMVSTVGLMQAAIMPVVASATADASATVRLSARATSERM